MAGSKPRRSFEHWTVRHDEGEHPGASVEKTARLSSLVGDRSPSRPYGVGLT